MGFSIRFKIIFITGIILAFAIGATALANSYVFSQEYTDVLQSRALVISQSIKSQLNRLLALGIPLEELSGFEKQLQDTVNTYEDIAYAMVIDLDGRILFHNDPAQHNKIISDAETLNTWINGGETPIFSDHTDEFVDAIIPVFDRSDAFVGVVRLGFPSEVITQKTTRVVILSGTVALIALIAAVSLLIGTLSHWVTRPLAKLMTAIQEIESGQAGLAARVDIDSKDEIGELSTTFNRMSAQLAALIDSLEERVATRTRDLRIASDVARQITQVLDLNELLNKLVEKTRQGFDLYFVSIFLFDTATETLTLEAATGEAGTQMKANNVQVHLQTRPSLVAKTARDRNIILINDVSQNEFHAANPLLPETQSEIALPLLVGENLVGVLNLQSTTKEHFTSSNTEILRTLAEQIAIAVNNAQLYEQQAQLAHELQRLDQVKTQFLASMSHELRTPLNGIMNFTEMVAMGMIGPVNDEQKSLLKQSLDSSKHLLNLINDVLDITKIQAGKLNLFIEDDVNLYEELNSAISLVKPLLRSDHVTLVEDIDDNLPMMGGDRRRIRQILINLLSNASKFTNEGTITIRAKNQGDHILFAVIDTGIGIPEEMLVDIFESFVQTADGVKQAEGTGLGLPITKNLVEAHGGKIWVESSVDNGTALYVTLPIYVKEPA